MKLRGKVALVTGSSAGIGAAIAQGLATEGADVIVNYSRDRAGAERTADNIKALNRDVLILQADVGIARDVARVFRDIRRRFKRLDILVNNAGISPKGPFDEFTEEDWDRVINTNLKSVFLCCKQALPLMGRGSAILNVSSVHAAVTLCNHAVYAASKGGVEALTRGLALDFAEKEIRVNALRPGLIEVERERLDSSDPAYSAICARIPAGRPGRVNDLVAAAVLLCSDDSSFITGQVIPIDGGQGIVLNTPFPKGFFELGARKALK